MCTRTRSPSPSCPWARRPRRRSSDCPTSCQGPPRPDPTHSAGRAPVLLRSQRRRVRAPPRAPRLGLRVRRHCPVAHAEEARRAAQTRQARKCGTWCTAARRSSASASGPGTTSIRSWRAAATSPVADAPEAAAAPALVAATGERDVGARAARPAGVPRGSRAPPVQAQSAGGAGPRAHAARPVAGARAKRAAASVLSWDRGARRAGAGDRDRPLAPLRAARAARGIPRARVTGQLERQQGQPAAVVAHAPYVSSVITSTSSATT